MRFVNRIVEHGGGKLGVVLLLSVPTWSGAQLVDPHAGVSVPGGSIAKTLEQQIGNGMGDLNTPQTSTYLIFRDPARSIRRGRQLFQRKFSRAEGLGPRVNFDSSGDIAVNAALGAGLADSCAACHGRPRGSAGFGGDVVTRPDSRDAPHLFGLGLVEMLADEMTAELRSQREAAAQAAASRNGPVDAPLSAKGISFGSISAFPDGTFDTSSVDGVDADLRVKPFFHEGRTISIREFIVGAFKDEMGLQSPDPVLCAATDPVFPQLMVSNSGMVLDPALDTFERPPVCDGAVDGDQDGIANEVDPAVVDFMEFYLLNYFKPATGRTTNLTRRGERTMRRIGCTECHVQNLTVENDRRVADVETRFDRRRGIFNRLFATATAKISTVEDGDPNPLQLSEGGSFEVKNIFSDFRRHDLGPAFHERQHDGSIVREFVTEPLWGVATTAPYGHDGRSINLTEVILRHGGEAQASRDAFARLSFSERRLLLYFLSTLVLFPPDDTASNLNPGNPAGDPQTEHGSIDLSQLFKIAGEGPE